MPQHTLWRINTLAQQRLLLFGLNPYIPGMYCLHYVSSADGSTLHTEWRYLDPRSRVKMFAKQDASIVWQVRVNMAVGG